MRVKSVTYRLNQPSASNQYIHQHAECTVELTDGESYEEGFEYARYVVEKQLGLIDEGALKKMKRWSRFVGV